MPERVAKELRNYLTCGVLQYGFQRVLCPSGDYETVVPYSCKGRGFCPSCFGKRGAEAVAHLLDQVLPWAPYRQWASSAQDQRRVNSGNSTIPFCCRGALICLRQTPCLTLANSSINTLRLRIRPVLPLLTSMGKTCPCLASR